MPAGDSDIDNLVGSNEDRCRANVERGKARVLIPVLAKRFSFRRKDIQEQGEPSRNHFSDLEVLTDWDFVPRQAPKIPLSLKLLIT